MPKGPRIQGVFFHNAAFSFFELVSKAPSSSIDPIIWLRSLPPVAYTDAQTIARWIRA